jgi:hypothetical protein
MLALRILKTLKEKSMGIDVVMYGAAMGACSKKAQ